MKTTVATSIASEPGIGSARILVDDVTKQLGGAAPRIALVFASTQQPLPALLSELASLLPGTTLLGASSAGEFTGVEERKGSATLVAIAGDLGTHAVLAEGLAADVEGTIARAVSHLPPRDPARPYRTAIMLLDPLAGRSEEATLTAAALLGDDVKLAGGAAGDDLKMQKTFVGCGTRAASDAVVLAVVDSKVPLGVGAAHGHRAMSRDHVVTDAEGAVVRTVDGRPAWEVWREDCRELSGVDPSTLAEAEIGGFLLRFEAGLRTGTEYKVRAPLSRGSDGSLAFACGIPQGTVFQIMRSEAEWQVASASLAATRARAQLGGADVAGAVVFDCICRNLILGSRFQDAVQAIRTALGGAPLAGFETYGEIALDVGDMSGFHNTTSVVLAFPA